MTEDEQEQEEKFSEEFQQSINADRARTDIWPLL